VRERGGRLRRRVSRRVNVPVLVIGIMAGSLASVGPVGASPRSPAPYIVNGTTTTIAQWPYLVGLLRSSIADPYAAQFCGGSVVAPDLVLTAAHCVDDTTAGALDILYGATILQVGAGTRIGVTSISVHPAWDPDTNQNDLAVVHLDTEIPATPIVVAPPGYEGVWAAGNTVQSAGWGCTHVTSLGACVPGGFPTDLRAGSMPMRNDNECASVFGDLFDSDTMRCAGWSSSTGAATDTCQGDSGGPLRIARRGLPPMLVGIVSWGINCGRLPGAYTRVESFRSWLRDEGVPIPTVAFRGAPTKAITGQFDQTFACDFNADRVDDIFFYTPGDGPELLRLGTSEGTFRDGPTVNVGGNFDPVSGDFNGDGACDILWYRPGGASEAYWRGSAFGFVPIKAPSIVRTYAPFSDDFDGDGYDDIFWYGASGTRSLVWYGSDHGFIAGPNLLVPADAVAVGADFSGNGRADVYFDRAEPDPDVTWAGTPSGFTDVSGPTMIPGDGPLLTGDFDGDGFVDLFRDRPDAADELWRGRNGARFERRSHPLQPGVYQGVGGHFDGDPRGDLYWYREGLAPEVLWRGLG
jgi:secreted trypsin-like serine protease